MKINSELVPYCGYCESKMMSGHTCACNRGFMYEKTIRWDLDYLALSEFWAKLKSKDPSTQTGAVLVDEDRRIINMGYNGFPIRMMDHAEWYGHRPTKYSRVVHCEMNAILSSDGAKLKGSTLYTWPFPSCDRCAVHVIQVGVARVVAPKPDPTAKMYDSIVAALNYFREVNMKITLYGA